MWRFLEHQHAESNLSGPQEWGYTVEAPSIRGRSLQPTKRIKEIPMTELLVPATVDRAVVGEGSRDCVFLPQPPAGLS